MVEKLISLKRENTKMRTKGFYRKYEPRNRPESKGNSEEVKVTVESDPF